MVNKENICINCHKYVFDEQDISPLSRMTVNDYIDKILRQQICSNKPSEAICEEFGFNPSSYVSKAECELCGAPHAVISTDNSLISIVFFFSGTKNLSEKDTEFINFFQRKYLTN